MTEVGNGMTTWEDRAHFSMWAMLAAPLIPGNDLRNASKQTMAILTNKEVIVVDQDPIGIEGFPAISEDGLEAWAKPLANDGRAIYVLNRSGETKNLDFDLTRRKIVFTSAISGCAGSLERLDDQRQQSLSRTVS